MNVWSCTGCTGTEIVFEGRGYAVGRSKAYLYYGLHYSGMVDFFIIFVFDAIYRKSKELVPMTAGMA